MRFEVVQSFDASLGDTIRLYTDPEFFTGLTGLTKIATPELIERHVGGPDSGPITVRLRYRFIAPLPGAVTAVVDPKKISWVETTVTDLEKARATVAFAPDHYADKLSCSATVDYQEHAEGTRRTVRGELRARVLLVGGKVEAAIVSGLKEHLREEAAQASAALGSPHR